MASSTATRARQSYTTEQVIQNIFADEDSENEQVESETDESEEEETSGENDEHIQVKIASFTQDSVQLLVLRNFILLFEQTLNKETLLFLAF